VEKKPERAAALPTLGSQRDNPPGPLSRFSESLCYTHWRSEKMKIRSKSYPDKIRRIAEDLSKMRNLYEVDRTVEKLRMIANELEHNLKKALLKKG